MTIEQAEQYHTKNQVPKEGNYWFRRFFIETKKKDSNVRFKRIKHGFYRIYYKGGYMGECHKDMPPKGYEFEIDDPRFEYKSYYEQYEDQAETTMKVKNFREGYHDNIRRIERRLYMINNDEEFNKTARNNYKRMNIL